MKKLTDKGFRIWLTTFILVGVLFVLPAEWIVSKVDIPGANVLYVRSVTIALSAILALWAFSRYNSHAAKTANATAEYGSVDECEKDILNDNATHILLLSIAWVFLTLGIGAALMGVIIATGLNIGVWPAIKANIPLDWGIAYLILVIFNFKMAKLRAKERDLTVKNSLLSMERKPLVMGA